MYFASFFFKKLIEYKFEYGTKEVLGNKDDKTCANCGEDTGISLKDHFCETCDKVGQYRASEANPTHTCLIEIVAYTYIHICLEKICGPGATIYGGIMRGQGFGAEMSMC